MGRIQVNYKEEVSKAMRMLALQSETIFLGQSVRYPGHAMFGTMEGVPDKKRIEMPVAEDMQMGISTGLALQGIIPISIYPRWDFLILATNQLINHLDKMEEMSNGEFTPKVIIRTMVGSMTPLRNGPQHRQDHTKAYQSLVTNIDVYRLEEAEDVFRVYMRALRSRRSSIVVEVGDLY
ncbi:MAG: hypothetical protein ACFFD4_07615 [Candidatus Odinarchaeota archaeon]